MATKTITVKLGKATDGDTIDIITEAVMQALDDDWNASTLLEPLDKWDRADLKAGIQKAIATAIDGTEIDVNVGIAVTAA